MIIWFFNTLIRVSVFPNFKTMGTTASTLEQKRSVAIVVSFSHKGSSHRVSLLSCQKLPTLFGYDSLFFGRQDVFVAGGRLKICEEEDANTIRQEDWKLLSKRSSSAFVKRISRTNMKTEDDLTTNEEYDENIPDYLLNIKLKLADHRLFLRESSRRRVTNKQHLKEIYLSRCENSPAWFQELFESDSHIIQLCPTFPVNVDGACSEYSAVAERDFSLCLSRPSSCSEPDNRRSVCVTEISRLPIGSDEQHINTQSVRTAPDAKISECSQFRICLRGKHFPSQTLGDDVSCGVVFTLILLRNPKGRLDQENLVLGTYLRKMSSQECQEKYLKWKIRFEISHSKGYSDRSYSAGDKM